MEMEKEITELGKSLRPHHKLISVLMTLLIIIILFYAAIDPTGFSSMGYSLVSLFLVLLFCYGCSKGCGMPRQQQQVIVTQSVSGKSEPMRVCPKCGWQNDRNSKFCGDCGYEFSKRRKTSK